VPKSSTAFSAGQKGGVCRVTIKFFQSYHMPHIGYGLSILLTAQFFTAAQTAENAARKRPPIEYRRPLMTERAEFESIVLCGCSDIRDCRT